MFNEDRKFDFVSFRGSLVSLKILSDDVKVSEV